MKNILTIIVLVIITFSCSKNDDRPNCLEIDTGGDFDPTIMSCEQIQAVTTVDCTCD